MNALNRVKTRTQHYASSPRKTATPAKLRTTRTTRRSSKRQRLGVSAAFAPLPSNDARVDDETTDEATTSGEVESESDSDGDTAAGDATFIAPTPRATIPVPTRRGRSAPNRKKPLGDVFTEERERPLARLRTRGRRSLGTKERVRTRQTARGRLGVVAGEEGGAVMSPRKRKRGRGRGGMDVDDEDGEEGSIDTGSEANWTEMGDEPDGETPTDAEADDEDEAVGTDEADDTDETDEAGEVDEVDEVNGAGGEADGEVDMTEAEPELISTDDLFYLEEALEWQLHRLRKAELVRLWKVVGMWEDEDEDEEGEATMMKPELVDGLLKRRETSLSQREDTAVPEAIEAEKPDVGPPGSAAAPIIIDDDDDEDGPVPMSDDDEDEEVEVDFSEATQASLTRLLRDQLVKLCEARGLEVGGTKPQLAKSLLDWYEEQSASDLDSVSSGGTARPGTSLSPAPPATWRPNRRSNRTKSSSKDKDKIIHAVATPRHAPGQPTPVLLRDHIHATDPATPPHSPHQQNESSRRTSATGEAELNLDLSELGLEDAEIKGSQLQKLEKIGSGGFKEVYVGKWRNRKVAISEFRDPLSEMDIRELKLLAEFSHKNIVKFKGICIPEPDSDVHCMLVSELCENGDLFDYIRNVPRPPLKRVLGIMLDMARGLEYLHTRSPAIIHRDVKSSNILINRTGVAKVGDFGLARVKHSTRSMIRSLVGTVNWQAPELWHPEPRYDYKVDVFSAGVVFWEMLAGWTGDKKYPWEGHNEHYIYDAVGQKHRRPEVKGLVEEWGEEPVRLIQRMWHQDPRERPTMTDVVVDLEVLVAEAGRK